MTLDPQHVEWSRKLFATLKDKGAWAVPRSGLIYCKRDNKFVLTERMPWMQGMPCSPAELKEQQDSEHASIKRHFEAAGVIVLDESHVLHP